MSVTVDAGERMLRIGEVARGAGVSVRAVRYYEQQGLLTAERSPAGQRLYREDAIDRVRFFQQMFAAGLTSRRIAELLPCWNAGHTDAEQRAMLREERRRLQAKIDELQAARDRLDEVIAVTETHP
ncbi:MerR family transcriptional regulator [Streptomyces aquilus]|uniref:MerR family transcriptional regulator n=1 Tax=Streptomyces aquilus TaxID=2548456 RepID=UPI00368BE551